KVLGARDRDPELRAAAAKALATIQLTLPGTPFLFQGQEIGAVNQEFTSVGDLQDVESRNRYTELRETGLSESEALAQVLPGARAHARGPLRGPPRPTTGFTAGPPWPTGRADSRRCTVAEPACAP